MIPKLIHQTAKTSDVPPACVAYQQSVRRLHPDWKYTLWTDADNSAFVREKFPQLQSLFDDLPKNIMRADVIRYLIIYRLGGLYLDLDYEMLKPFDLIEHDIVLPYESDGDFGPGNDRVCNSVFAAAPGHPLFKMAIDELVTHPPGADADALVATGPVFLTRIFRAALAAGIDVYSPARPVFSPRTPHSQREYRSIVADGISYGIHHCHGSWREYTRGQRLRARLTHELKRLVR